MGAAWKPLTATTGTGSIGIDNSDHAVNEDTPSWVATKQCSTAAFWNSWLFSHRSLIHTAAHLRETREVDAGIFAGRYSERSLHLKKK